GVLPRRAGEEGDHRARRVLRRESWQTAQPPGFAISQLYAVLVRSCAAAARRSDDEDRAAGPGSLKRCAAGSGGQSGRPELSKMRAPALCRWWRDPTLPADETLLGSRCHRSEERRVGKVS